MRMNVLPALLPACVLALSLAALVPTAASAQTAAASPGLPRTPAPAGAEAYLISPQDGAQVHNPVRVQFGLKGMGIAPAGIAFPNTGHHHLLIDIDAPSDPSAPLPANEHIVHFGKGQTETTLTLSPGRHTLQLLLADQNHVPHEPPVLSPRITITVLP